MKTSELFKTRQVLSFEVFPPKRNTATTASIYSTLDRMRTLHPDFISVTYGASGSDNCAATIDIASSIKQDYGIESVAHLPCINLTHQAAEELLVKFKQRGIENILALRGDRPDGIEVKGEFTYASDLVTFIREHGDFNIIGACYPECHFESPRLNDDIRNLKKKVDSGVSHLISQLCFSNEIFYDFMDRIELAGIDVPVEAGIFPVSNKVQVERIVSMCHCKLPPKFVRLLNRFENNPIAFRDAGIAYAVDQIVDLVTQGVKGIHLYTMNNSYTATKIYEAVNSLFMKPN